MLLVAMLALQQWSNGSADGTVRIGKPVADDTSVAATTPVALQTRYFDTLLPAGFTVKRQTDTPEGAGTHLQLVANTKGVSDQQFAATVGTLPGNGLADVGDYNLRVKDTATYTRFTPSGLPSGAVAFRGAGSATSFVVFWPHGTQYVELAFSSDGGVPYPQLEATYVQVVDSWQWK